MENQSEFLIRDKKLIQYLGHEQDIVIPNGVEVICNGAFSHVEKQRKITYDTIYYYKKIRSVRLPKSVKYIEDYALKENLMETLIIESPEITLGNFCFYDCPKLKKVLIPGKINNLIMGQFKLCPAMADKDGYVIFNDVLFDYYGKETNLVIPDRVRYIAPEAFRRKDHVESVIMKENVEYIGNDAFGIMYNLKKVEMTDCVHFLGKGVFAYTTSLQEMKFTQSVDEIPDQTFVYSSIDFNQFPPHLKRIGKSAFFHAGITKADLPDTVEEIGEEAFSSSKIERIVIPPKVKRIEKNTFWACGRLKEAVLHDDVEYIGPEAFYYCNLLEHMDYPKNLKRIDEKAFKLCKKINVAENPDRAIDVAPDAYEMIHGKEKKKKNDFEKFW